MKIFIAGGAGFIGSNLAHFFIKKYPNYYLFLADNLSQGNRNNIRELEKHPHLDFEMVDIVEENRLQEILGQFKPDILVNAVHTDNDPEYIKTFMYGNFLLLEAVRQYVPDLRLYLYLSTDEVYGEQQAPSTSARPFSEEDTLQPQNPRAAAQAGADLLTQTYFHKHNLPTLTLRLANIYGSYQDRKKLLPLLITHALVNDPLPLYGDGNQNLNWLYIDDFISLLDTIIHTSTDSTSGQAFNVAGISHLSLLEVSELILAQLGKEKDLIEFIDDEKIIFARGLLNGSKLSGQFKWKPSTNFNEGLKRTIEWYRTHIATKT